MDVRKLMEREVVLFINGGSEGYVDDVILIDALDSIEESDKIEITIKKESK